jgi:hypothetical protein
MKFDCLEVEPSLSLTLMLATKATVLFGGWARWLASPASQRLLIALATSLLSSRVSRTSWRTGPVAPGVAVPEARALERSKLARRGSGVAQVGLLSTDESPPKLKKDFVCFRRRLFSSNYYKNNELFGLK